MCRPMQFALGFVATISVSLVAPLASAELAVIESEGGGPTPENLVALIVDAGSSYTLVSGSVSTAINATSGSHNTNLRAVGSFTGGLTTPGTFLPNDNQPNPTNPTATYSGGVGISAGVCLTTGVASDTDPTASGRPGRGIGAEGPNNGEFGWNEGEVGASFDLFNVIDEDFNEHVFGGAIPPDSGDPTVLEFKITLQEPGFVRLRYVFAADEFPHFIFDEFNDSFATLIKKDACQDAEFENIAVFKELGNPMAVPFSLQTIALCGPPIFKRNQLAPAPSVFVNPVSPHAIDDTPGAAPFDYDTKVPYFDHEYGGFTKALTSETAKPLSVGTYTVKIVVHDVGDANDDCALFVEQGSLKLFSLNPGDYNGDGCVNTADYDVLRSHFGVTPATFYDGDGNGDCIVDIADYIVWRDRLSQTGNKDCRGDFDRDGDVDTTDYGIWNTYDGLQSCASRFEGDADGDGDVDNTDLTIWYGEWDFGCGCSGGGQSAQSSSSGISLASLQTQLPESPDVDGDGTVSEKDLAEIDAIIASWSGDSLENVELEAVASQPDIVEAAPDEAPVPSPTEPAPLPRDRSLLLAPDV